MTFRVSWRMRSSGRHKNNLLFVGRLLGQVQLYGERESWGGGREGRRLKNHMISNFRDGIIGGVPYSIGPPPNPLSTFQVLPAAHSGSESPGSRDPDKADSGAVRQELAVSRQMRAPSEILMPPTGRADPAPSGS